MTVEITDELLRSLLKQIESSPGQHNAGSLEGDREQNLLGLRELRSRGLIDGAFLNDSTRPGDSGGPFLDNAARLTPR